MRLPRRARRQDSARGATRQRKFCHVANPAHAGVRMMRACSSALCAACVLSGCGAVSRYGDPPQHALSPWTQEAAADLGALEMAAPSASALEAQAEQSSRVNITDSSASDEFSGSSIDRLRLLDRAFSARVQHSRDQTRERGMSTPLEESVQQQLNDLWSAAGVPT